MKKKIERAGILGVSLLALGAMTSPASAQEGQTPAPVASEGDEEIVVTGSRIHHDNFNAPSPVQIITREESTRAGFATTTEVLQSSNVAPAGAQINNLYGGLVVNGGGGVNTLGLRGFGPTSTLVLLNGRRLTPAGVRGAVGAADLNTIPSALVARVEILKDGASSIYGSDAVAGVVNVITDDNLDGFVLEGQRNFTEAGGGEQNRISLSGGGNIGTLSLVGSVEYYEREAQTYGDRPWSRCPLDGLRAPFAEDIDPRTGEPKCFTINFVSSAGVTVNTIGTAARPGFGGPGAAATGNFNRWRPNSFFGDGTPGMGVNMLDGFEGVNGGGNGFANRDTFDDELLDQEFITPTRNLNVFFAGSVELPGNHELYGEVLYSHRDSSSHGYTQLTLDYPNNELLPAELRAGGPQNPLSSYPNPAPTGVTLPPPYATQVRAFIGFGNYGSDEDVSYTRLVGGIRGDLPFLQDWHYDANFQYGRNDSEQTVESFLVDHVFNSLVISTNPGQVAAAPANLVRRTPDGVNYICAITATNPAYGCIPAPALTTDVIGGTLPSDFVDWVQERLTQTNVFNETTFSLIADGPLFELPAGQVQVVLGVEHRQADITDTPDINSQRANVYNFTAASITKGEDSVTEVFGEVEIPLLRDAPFAHSLTTNLSARYTDYESYGSDSTYKIGLTWEPIPDLLLRASQGTSYRAPALFEQFLGGTTGFQAGTADPCSEYGDLNPANPVYVNCDAQIGDPTFVQNNGITVISGGGAAFDLFAETSDNQTIGFSWRPLRDVEGWGEFSIAADRFSIELNDSVSQAGYVNILNSCYGSPDLATEPFCTFVQRDPGTNRLTVFDTFRNISAQTAEGWDYGARWAHAFMGGEFGIDVNLTQYTSQTYQLIQASPATEQNGDVLHPEFSGNALLNYNIGPWNLHYDVTWVDNMSDYAAQAEDPATSPFILSTPDYYLQNASVQYDTGAWLLTVGVRNLTDEQPPVISSVDNLINGVGQTPLFSGFDYIGRQFFVNIAARF